MPDCPFCEGRYAAEAGDLESANPYPEPDADPRSPEYRDSDWWLWGVGYGVGSVDLSAAEPAQRQGNSRGEAP